MAKTCINHAEQAAATMCRQCHKPICTSCTMVTPQGSFCSSECSVLHREFKDRFGSAGAPRGGSQAGKVVVLIILVIIAGIFGIHLAVRFGADSLRSIDLLGRFLPSIKQR